MQVKLFRDLHISSVEAEANAWLRENGAGIEIVGTQIAAAEDKVIIAIWYRGGADKA
jgi:hypothetical protein